LQDVEYRSVNHADKPRTVAGCNSSKHLQIHPVAPLVGTLGADPLGQAVGMYSTMAVKWQDSWRVCRGGHAVKHLCRSVPPHWPFCDMMAVLYVPAGHAGRRHPRIAFSIVTVSRIAYGAHFLGALARPRDRTRALARHAASPSAATCTRCQDQPPVPEKKRELGFSSGVPQ